MSSDIEIGNIAFDLPKNQSNVIKVIGVGGGGSNAINHMFKQGIKGVDFVICNTDAQALQSSGIPNKIQLGVTLTEGLGAGANPDIGASAAEESFDDLQRMLDTNTKMVFITAGMGGGTGTGAAPVIARMAKKMGILTVGIVTIPFKYEGETRIQQAQEGLENLRKEVDSLIIIDNNNLQKVYGKLGFKTGFAKADEVLAIASKGIAEVITHHYIQNIDLHDVKTVLSDSGTAIMGSATAQGEGKAKKAISTALDSPLLNDNKITGAKDVLLSIVSGEEEVTIDEICEINEYIQDQAGNKANIIMGIGEDINLGDALSVTVIATGFDVDQQHKISNTEAPRKVLVLKEDEDEKVNTPDNTSVEVKESKQIDVTSLTQQKEKVEVKKETVEPRTIHVLDVSELDTFQPEVKEPKKETPKNDFEIVPTTEVLKNLDVVYDEVLAPKKDFGDFEIISTIPEVSKAKEEEPEVISAAGQVPLILDFGITEETIDFVEKKEVEPSEFVITDVNSDSKVEIQSNIETPQSLEPEVKIVGEITITESDVDVVNEVVEETKEEIAIPSEVEDGPVFHNLEDYSDEAEEEVTPNTEVEAESTLVAEEVSPLEDITIITKEPSETDIQLDSEVDLDPIYSPISEFLKSTAAKRKKTMKGFNYKFNNQKVDEMERVPAFKRQGLELKDVQHSSENNRSKTMLSTDENDDIQLRSNNSFLHDNVD